MKKFFRFNDVVSFVSRLSLVESVHSARRSNGVRSGKLAPTTLAPHMRRLVVEELEDRRLLSVSAAEYDAIREAYADFGLSSTMSDVNIIEIEAINLSATNLRDAITEAGTTSEDDLIVVRTTDEANTITYAAATDEISISIDSAQYGKLTIVGFGTKQLTIDAAQLSRVLNITAGTVNLGNLAFVNGYATGNGGAIYSLSSLTLSDCTFTNNVATSKGGGVYNTGILTANDSTFCDNTGSWAGAVYSNSVVSIDHSVFYRNKATDNNSASGAGAGALYLASGTATIVSSTFDSNNTQAEGGAIKIGAGSMEIKNSYFLNNTSNNDGGAIFNWLCSLTIRSSFISDNNATGGYGGGGIYNNNELIIINSTLSNNSALNGGGIYNCGGTTVTNCTISGNTASSSGGGIYNYSGTVNLYNTIVVMNTANSGTNVHGTVYGSNNLTSGVMWGSVSADNVEYTGGVLFRNIEQNDYRIFPGSQAFNAGSNENAYVKNLDESCVDLAGYPRFNSGTIDIGAYEAEGISLSQYGIFQGTVHLSWVKPNEQTKNVRITWLSGTTTNALGTYQAQDGFEWDTTVYANAGGQLQVEYLDAAGKKITQFYFAGTIINDDEVIVHRNNVAASEIWEADKVHIVMGRLNIATGVTVDIPSDVIVKFWKAGYFNTQASSIVRVGSDVVFTRVEDDDVAGDTNRDGHSSVPVYGNTYCRGTGTYDIASSATFKYVLQIRSGKLTQDETWLPGQVYRITDTLTILSGVTLTIQPGAIIKMETGKSIIVESGGTLIAEGNSAQPIVFTSIRDDSWGGDTNEDESVTMPAMGDWNYILNKGGNIVLDHTIVRYCGNLSGNGALQCNEGLITFDNSVLEFVKYYGLQTDGGNITAVNSIIRECATHALNGHVSGSITVTNCDIVNVNSICWMGKITLYNCVLAYFNTLAGISGGNHGSYNYCAFYNPAGIGPQSVSLVGSNGNIWVDPKFRDALNNDFTLLPASGLIDAGTAIGSSATDILGSSRCDDPYITDTGVADENGNVPDIGVYEFTENSHSDIDLAIVSAIAPESGTIGDKITVQYTVENNGARAIEGVWTDALFLISDRGQKIQIAEVINSAAINPGSRHTFYAQVVLPFLTEGNWYFAVHVNPNRNIFEGMATANNYLKATNATAISVPVLTDLEGTLTTKKSEPALYQVVVKSGEAFYLKTSSSAAVSVYLQENFAPTSTNYAYKAAEFAENQRSLYLAPTEVDRTFYLLVETKAEVVDVLYTIKSESILDVLGVAPTTVSNAGASTLSFTGAGFQSGISVALKQGATTIFGTNLQIVSGSNASATFDLTGVSAGDYALIVALDGQSVSLENAIAVDSNGVGAKLSVDLQIPDAVRVGRIYTGYLNYENTGDCDMLMPIFTIQSNSTAIASSSDAIGEGTSIYVLGLGSENSAGILRASESGRIPFYFKAGSDNLISWYTWGDGGEIENNNTWTKWTDLFADVSAAATQLGLRGVRTFDYRVVESFAKAMAAGEDSTGLSGTLRDSRNGSALADCTLTATWTSTDGFAGAAYAQTDENGFYAFNYLPENTTVSLSVISGAYILSTETVQIEASDVVGYNLAALLFGSITGKVFDSAGNSIGNMNVIAYNGDKYYSAVTDTYGTFAISDMELGTYCIYTNSWGKYLPSEEQTISVIGKSDISPQVSIIVQDAYNISGKITDSETKIGIDGVNIYVYDEMGEFISGAITDENGLYTIYLDREIEVITVTADKSGYNRTQIATDVRILDISLTASSISLSGYADIPAEYEPEDVCVIAYNDNNSLNGLYYVFLDENGAFSFPGILPGTYKIFIFCGDTEYPIESVTITNQSLDIGCLSLLSQNESNLAMASLAAKSSESLSILKTLWLTQIRTEAILSVSGLYSFVKASSGEKEAYWTKKLYYKFLKSTSENGMMSVPSTLVSNNDTIQNKIESIVKDSKEQAVEYFTNNHNSNSKSFLYDGQIDTFIGLNFLGQCAGGTGSRINKSEWLGTHLDQQYDDNHSYSCQVNADVLDHSIRLTFSFSFNIVDTVDFCPGNLGPGLFIPALTSPLSVLEQYRQAFDVPFTATYNCVITEEIPFEQESVVPPQLKITNVTTSSISLKWDSIKDMSSYKIFYSDGEKRGERSTTDTSYTLSGLKEDTTYSMKIKLVTPLGESDWGGGCTAKTPKSCDPNEIAGPIGADFDQVNYGTEDDPNLVITTPNWIRDDQETDFTIYFENKSTATAAAQEVYIDMQLPEQFDWNTFESAEFCVGNQIFTLSDSNRIAENMWLVSQTSTGQQIQISIQFDEETGAANWYLRSYVATTADHFPASAYDGFVPINDENGSGEGYVKFHVCLDDDLTANTKVEIQASIIFDSNEPIITNTWINTIDSDRPTSEIMLNEISGESGISVAWTGSDEHSGIAYYDVYYSTDNGEFYNLWLSQTTDTQGLYDAAAIGTTYTFKIVAYDNVGNTNSGVTAEITITGDDVLRISRSEYIVQEGCSLYLSAEGSTGENLTYLWDLSGSETELSDSFHERESGFWISINDLGFTPGDHTIRLKVRDGSGIYSASVSATIHVIAVTPTVTVRTSEYTDGQVLKLALDVFSPGGRVVEQWKINWGDSAEPQVFDSLTNILKTAHCYTLQDAATAYTVTLEITDTAGFSSAYALTRHTVPGKVNVMASPLAVESAPTESIPLAAVPPIFIASETTNKKITESLTETVSDDSAAALLYWNTRSANVRATANFSFEPEASRFQTEKAFGDYDLALQLDEPLQTAETPLTPEEFDLADTLDLDFINNETVGDYADDPTVKSNDLETSIDDEISATEVSPENWTGVNGI